MKLSEFKRAEIIGLRKSSLSIRKISEVLQIPKSTISDAIQRYEQHQKVTNLPRTGQPFQFNDNTRKTPRNTATQIQKRVANATGVNVSVRTIRCTQTVFD